MDRTQKMMTICGALLALGTSLWISEAVFHRAPITTDEQSYLFQAHLFAEGKIKHPAPIFIQPFRYPMIILDERVGWLSRYPPGHSLWLAPGVWLSEPYWTVALAAGLGVLLTAFAAARIGGAVTAAVLMLLLSPYYAFTYGTLLSHVSGFVAAAGMLLAYIRWQQTGRNAWALAAGLFWAWIFLNRTYTALLMAIPFAVDALLYLWRRRTEWTAWRGVVLFAGAACAGILAIMIYNYLAVGNPLKMTYLYYDATDKLGFGLRHHGPVFPAPKPVEHTLAKGLGDLWTNVLQLDRWMWGFRGGLLVWLGLTWVGWSRRWSLLMIASMLSVWLGYILFWYPGWNETGPNYFFEIYPAMILTASMGIAALARRFRQRPRARLAIAAAGLVIWSGAAVAFGLREGRIQREYLRPRDQILDLFRDAPPRSLIFTTSHLIQEVWPNHDLAFNPRGLKGDVIIARSLEASDRALIRYFKDYTPLRISQSGSTFHLAPLEEQAPFRVDVPIRSLHRLTGLDEYDPEQDNRIIRVARDGEHEAGKLLFGRYYAIYPGRFAVEFDVRARPDASGAPVVTLEVAANKGMDVLLSRSMDREDEWTTVRLELDNDAFIEIEPRAIFHGSGDAQVAAVRVMEIE